MERLQEKQIRTWRDPGNKLSLGDGYECGIEHFGA
jgi:hypothetical protein